MIDFVMALGAWRTAIRFPKACQTRAKRRVRSNAGGPRSIPFPSGSRHSVPGIELSNNLGNLEQQ